MQCQEKLFRSPYNSPGEFQPLPKWKHQDFESYLVDNCYFLTFNIPMELLYDTGAMAHQ